MLGGDATISGTRMLLHTSMTLHFICDSPYCQPLLRRLQRTETLDAQISSAVRIVMFLAQVRI
jgi:hypothetical protein